jgi:hypothetical protein
MCSLRKTPSSAPSASTTAAELWYTPAARRSKIGTTITTASSFATRCIASTVGPGIGSARSNRSASVTLQKYGALNSSCRQMICAPRAAASRTRSIARSTFSCPSTETVSWMRPSVNGSRGGIAEGRAGDVGARSSAEK